MELYDDYQKWVATNIDALQNVQPYGLSICSIPCKNLILVDTIAKGGGSYIIDTQCSGIKLAMKLYDGNVLGNMYTRDNYREILAMLKYSQLKSITDNFLSCYGYGIGCCILIPEKCGARCKIKELENYNLLQKTLGSDEEILDYVSMVREEGCETMVLTDLLVGKDLTTFPNTFTDRMIFEYVYSLLCSAYYFNQIPGDRHLDNVMVVKKEVISIEINDITLKFPKGLSIVHIDYQAMSDVYNINSSVISLIEPFCLPEPYAKVKLLLDSDLSIQEKIFELPLLFIEYRVNEKGILKFNV